MVTAFKVTGIPTGDQIFFWSFLYTVEALQTDTLVSTQLYLWQPSQNFAFLNSHTNSVLLHSRRQPAPVLLWTPFLYPEGVHLWQLPLYVIKSILSLEQWNLELKLCGNLEINFPDFSLMLSLTLKPINFVLPWFSPDSGNPVMLNEKWWTQTWKADQHVPGILCWEIWRGHS